MNIRNGILFRVAFISAALLSCQLSFADTSVDYNSVNLGALQSQYQKQLKSKVRKTRVRKTVSNQRRPKNSQKRIQNQELLQYKRLLSRQQQKRPQVKVHRPVRAVVNRAPARVQHQAAPANRVTQVQPPRRDAIFEAASTGNVGLIRQLLNKGVNVNQANNERETPLHMAAAKGHYSAVIYLINHGANIHARTVNNWLPIHHATRFRHAQIANYLKQRGSAIYARTSDGLSAVDMAKAVNDSRILGIFGIR